METTVERDQDAEYRMTKHGKFHMSNVTRLRASGDVEKMARESARRLDARFGISEAELHAAIKPLLLLMHDHGIGAVSIQREDTTPVITVDGESF
jgi:LDH2 family malate/lactate/ureidoglycolate dehydrogenase